MATVKTQTVTTVDRSNGRTTVVHYTKVNKSNRTGIASLIGGELKEHKGRNLGDFHIFVKSSINAKAKTLKVELGDYVFRTGKNKRWQVATRAHMKARFPNVKFS